MYRLLQSTLAGTPVLARAALITLLGMTTGLAVDRYVSPTGSNGNPGTFALPWQTVRYGANRLDPGDTLYVRGGTYAEVVLVNKSGTAAAPITITNYPNEVPVIDGRTIPDTDWQMLVNLRGDYIHVNGFEVKNCNMQANNPYPATPSGGYGVYMGGHDNRVSYMNVHHNRSVGILAGGDNSIVEDCWVWQNCQDNNTTPHVQWASGLTLSRGGLNGTGITHNAIARRNTVFNNWGEGLNTFEADGTLLEDNLVYDNFSVNLYISDARNVLAQRNLVYVSSNSLIPGSTSITLADEVAAKPRSANNKVINNFVYGGRFQAFSWTLVPGSGLDNVLIANNTFVNAQLQTGSYNGSGITNTSASIRNNIFLSDAGTPALVNSTTNISFSNNAWSHTAPAAVSGGSTDVVGTLQVARTGATTAGNLTTAYFKLLAGSPVIDKALALPGFTDFDFFRHPRAGLPDIGGHEIDSVPAPWTTQDIGAVGAPGAAIHSAGTFTVTGSGTNIWDVADEFRHVGQPSSGDCRISARVATQQATDPYSKAGLMIREDNSPGSRYAAVLVTPGNGVTFRWRPVANGICYQGSYATGVTAPRYLKLERIGSFFAAFHSSDGTTWTQVGTTQTLSMASSATVGLAVASDLNGALSTATFDHLAVVP